MRREVLKYLFDIKGACDLLMDFTKGKEFSNYLREPMLRSAVERQFEIIGEALKQAIEVDPSIAKRVSGTSRIVAFRNRLIHGYASISDEVVWGIVETNLPLLIREVDALLKEGR